MVHVFGLTRTRHVRADVSLIQEALREIISARARTGEQIPVDELPIVNGLAMLLSDAVADMDLYPTDDAGNRVDEFYPVLDQPNPEEDRAETLHKIVQSLYRKGNAFAQNGPMDQRFGVLAINVLDPNTVGHFDDPRDRLRVAYWTIDGRPIDRSQMSWWKINDDPTRGPMGRSPLETCATPLAAYGWAYRYLSDFFLSGGNPSSVMRSKLELSPTKIDELSEEWVTARKQRRPAFLPNHLEFDVPPTTGELEAVVGVLEFASAEFARLMNVPVSLVNAPVAGYSLQYSNVGDEFRRWLAVSLGTTWVRRVERGFSRLLPPGRRAKLDPSGLFPAELFPAAGSSDPTQPALPATPIEATAS